MAQAKREREALAGLLRRLVGRAEFSVPAQVYIAERCLAAGLEAEAAMQYQKILELAHSDSAAGQAAAKLANRVRLKLLTLRLGQRRFEEAQRQADELVRENPRSLRPRMEQGRVLMAWAEQEPDRYQEAAEHWIGVRNLLYSLREKPGEYYETCYNAALCCWQVARHATGETAMETALRGLRILKTELVRRETLDGPDTVARFRALIDKLTPLCGLPDSNALNGAAETGR